MICAVIIMSFHLGGVFGLEFSEKIPEFHQIISIISAAIATICVFFCGFYFFSHAYKSLKERNFDMNTLVSLGVLSAYIYSMWLFGASFWGHDLENSKNSALYFDSPVMILAFVLLGKMLESRAKARSSLYLSSLIKLMPRRATIILPNALNKEIDANELKIGDIIIVKSGENIPSDAIIISGEAQINEASINGESLPKQKCVGERVFAGTTNENGIITAKVDIAPNESVLANIIENLQNSASNKLNTQRLADKISNIFVPFVILISVLTLVFWSFYEPAKALNYAICVLVISCPCALGLAVPIALICAISNALKSGILIKNPAIIEQIDKINLVLFDKTGTLTKGVLSVEKTSLNDSDFALFSALCAKSTHPISKAIAKARKAEITPQNIEFSSGLGIECLYNGDKLILGNEKLLEKNGIFLNENDKNALPKGAILALCARNSRFLGFIALNDELKEGTKPLINALKAQNLKSIILSGDNKQSVEKIASKLEISEFYAELLPQQKADIVASFRQGSKVLFVGDGINDTVALKNADISVAVASASDIAKNAGDIVLINNDIMGVLKLKNLGSKTLKIIKQNLFWAFCYNIFCIPLAAGAFSTFNLALNPAISAFAMSMSSIIVVLNSLRLLKN